MQFDLCNILKKQQRKYTESKAGNWMFVTFTHGLNLIFFSLFQLLAKRGSQRQFGQIESENRTRDRTLGGAQQKLFRTLHGMTTNSLCYVIIEWITELRIKKQKLILYTSFSAVITASVDITGHILITTIPVRNTGWIQIVLEPELQPYSQSWMPRVQVTWHFFLVTDSECITIRHVDIII